MLHPTLQPVVTALAVTGDAIAEHRRRLCLYADIDYRNAAAIGFVEFIVPRLVGEVHTVSGRQYLADLVAMLAARDELAEADIAAEANGYTSAREDPEDPNFVNPPGVEGWSIPRSPK